MNLILTEQHVDLFDLSRSTIHIEMFIYCRQKDLSADTPAHWILLGSNFSSYDWKPCLCVRLPLRDILRLKISGWIGRILLPLDKLHPQLQWWWVTWVGASSLYGMYECGFLTLGHLYFDTFHHKMIYKSFEVVNIQKNPI